jgi:hypothetical protein
MTMGIDFHLPAGAAGSAGTSADAAAHAPLNAFLSEVGADPSEEGLSAEFLVALAQQRLSTIDGQLKEMVSLMNLRSVALDHARSASALIDQFRTQHQSDDTPLNFDATVTVTNADGSVRDTNLGDELRAIGIDPATYMSGGHGPDHAHLDDLVNAIRDRTEQLQQGSEIEQMKLQQLVQSRGQFVQTCSQIMSSMHETEKGIVANIRG